MKIMQNWNLGNIAVIHDVASESSTSYIYGHGLMSRVNEIGASAYCDADALGSIVGLSDSLGKYLNAYRYSPFGEAIGVSEAATNPFQFNGSLTRMRARNYDADSGRFVTPDPTQ